MGSVEQSEAGAGAVEPHASFEHVRAAPIESLNVVVEEYRHTKTGALHFHIATDNPENAFLVAFRTVPLDSTGVAHILEHTALCGSECYPVRDPFFMMLRRSLSTFMNAFTSSDWTAYPFASQNRKDFGNLLNVYLDAAFFPRLDRLDFAQEGHRLEFDRPDDPESELVFKGVVYNEMKGAMSAPTTVLWQTLTKHLYPTTTYHYNSGGDPERIPDLSYEQLREFYATHYHPSNAIFMTYGNISAAEHQARFDAQALSRFERLDTQIGVAAEKRYNAPVSVEESYAINESEETSGKTHIVLGWLLSDSFDLNELLKANLLTSILLEDGASPLRRALETTDLGSAPSPLCGLEDSNREMVFVCGLEGSDPGHSRAVEDLVLQVLRDVARDGVPPERVEAILHQLELHQREIGGDGFPYGLQLMLHALPAAVHRGDPIDVLNLDPALERLRREVRDPEFIKRLVKHYLLDNPHRVKLTLVPDTALGERRQQEEQRRLAAIKAGLSESERLAIVAQAKALEERQSQVDDPDVLPKVGIEDIPAEPHVPQGQTETHGPTQATYYIQGTNGLVYQQVVVDLPRLEDELVLMLPWFTSCLTEIGCGDRDYIETQAWQTRVSGGVEAVSAVRGTIDDVLAIRGHLTLAGKALARNHAQLTLLLQETFLRPRFDEHDRLREIIAQDRARWEQSVTAKGHVLAMVAASSGLGPAARLLHLTTGLAGIQAIKRLDAKLKDAGAMEEFAARLIAIHDRIVAGSRQFLLVGEQERIESLRNDVLRQWQDASPAMADSSWLSLPDIRGQVRQAWTTSTQVNFCAKAYPTVPAGHPDAASLAVLAGFLRNGFLHRAIREQGGAYGGGAGHDADIGAFRFYSYRDPRLVETLDDFDRAIDWVLGGSHEARLVEEAILGVISAIDKPGSPAGEATKAFHNNLYGRTRDHIQQFRQRVVAVTLDDLRRVAEAYLKPERASVVAITNQATLRESGDLGLEVIEL